VHFHAHINRKGKIMRNNLGRSILAISVLVALSACSGMTPQQKDTAIGAGVGAVGGAVLTGGSAVGTLGGAAVGAVIGHETGKDK
jgi:osmotically inducible lipoprotein OsmB